MNIENETRIRELTDKLQKWELAGFPPADAPLEESLEARELARWELHERAGELSLVYLDDTKNTDWLSDEERNLVHVGDCVKIIRSDERFWVRVEDADSYYLTGTVENLLIDDGNDHLFLGRRIHFPRRAVVDIMPEEIVR